MSFVGELRGQMLADEHSAEVFSGTCPPAFSQEARRRVLLDEQQELALLAPPEGNSFDSSDVPPAVRAFRARVLRHTIELNGEA